MKEGETTHRRNFPQELVPVRHCHRDQARTECGSLNLEAEKVGRGRKPLKGHVQSKVP